MLVHFVLRHGLSDETIEFSREVQAVPRVGETIFTDMGPDETDFEVDDVQHVLASGEAKIVVYATDYQPASPEPPDAMEVGEE